MSGRDVRRLAGRASNMTHEAKRDIVARIATGADAAGVTDIFVTREPFRIASAALEQISLNARVHIVEHKLTNSALGTNNVYPLLAEPTIAGLVAGLYATEQLPAPDSSESVERELATRSKVLHLALPDGSTDVALIDAVLLRNDHVGNLLPFAADKLAQVFLSRAEPEAVGMSPIGGYIEVVGEQDDHGMLVHLGGDQRIPFATPVLFRGPGVLACDGDRDHKLVDGATARVQLLRDGPWVPRLTDAMRYATEMGIMAADLNRL